MSEHIIIIKKYANRRLYNTETSMYVTLDDLAEMVRQNQNFEVVDARTGRDITHQVLTQIIFDEETKGGALMPIKFLRQLIKFYDHSLQSMVPQYLEMTMDVFTKNQERLRENATKLFGTNPFIPGAESLEAIQRRNMELFQKTFAMMNPFMGAMGQGHQSEDKDARIADLSRELEKMQAEIDRLKKSHK